MSYFHHHYASNSDLKEIVARHEGRTKPDNINVIYNFGTGFHQGITEPHKNQSITLSSQELLLINQMSRTFWKDELCMKIAMMPDFRREHEFYRVNKFGLRGVRCKTDGDSKSLRIILELKGLSVTTEKAFKESILHLDYDQGAAWYLDTTMYDMKLIVGISKKDPDLLFKMLINRDHPYYRSGMEKIKKAVPIWRMYGLE